MSKLLLVFMEKKTWES
jgi:hypothetical protein